MGNFTREFSSHIQKKRKKNRQSSKQISISSKTSKVAYNFSSRFELLRMLY